MATIYNADGNSSRVYLHRFLSRAASTIPADALVLDAGAGQSPYRALFDNQRYESADFTAVADKVYVPPTYECDLAEIPVADGRFDAVLLTQVLEHLPEPSRVLSELHRVSKPGASLWLTVPLFYEEHETPYDFFRYTQYGLRQVLEASGFEITEIDWMEGYFGTLSYQAQLLSRSLPYDAATYGGGLKGEAASVASRGIRRAARKTATALGRWDLRLKITSSGMPKNWQVIAVRR